MRPERNAVDRLIDYGACSLKIVRLALDNPSKLTALAPKVRLWLDKCRLGLGEQRLKLFVSPNRMIHFLSPVVVACATLVDKIVDSQTTPEIFAHTGIQLRVIRVGEGYTSPRGAKVILGIDIGRHSGIFEAQVPLRLTRRRSMTRTDALGSSLRRSAKRHPAGPAV